MSDARARICAYASVWEEESRARVRDSNRIFWSWRVFLLIFNGFPGVFFFSELASFRLRKLGQKRIFAETSCRWIDLFPGVLVAFLLHSWSCY